MTARLVHVLSPLVLVAACTGTSAPQNPRTLWLGLGLDARETQAALIDHDPPPF